MAEEAVININITPPSKSARGYLKRQRDFFDLMTRFRSFDPTAIDDMVTWIIAHCAHDGDEQQVRDALWEMSEDEFMAVMKATGGVEDEDGKENSVPPTKRGK